MAYIETLKLYRKADEAAFRGEETFTDKIRTSLWQSFRVAMSRRGWQMKRLSSNDKFTHFTAINKEAL